MTGPVRPPRFNDKIQRAFDDPRPWLVPACVEWLDRELDAADIVVEFGGGGSTPWFLARTQLVHTVEANPIWAHALLGYINERPDLLARWRLHFVPAMWSLDENGRRLKGRWRHHPDVLDDELIDGLEGDFLGAVSADIGATVVVSDGGPSRLTTLRRSTEIGADTARLIVVDNTEIASTETLVAELFDDGWIAHRFDAHVDEIPERLGEAWSTTVFERRHP